MISALKKLGLMLIVVIALKTAATWIIDSSAYFDQVINEELDPSQMFYTESEQVLKAEKEVFKNISEINCRHD